MYAQAPYGYAPFQPAQRAYALAPFRGGLVGADPAPPPQTFMQKLTAFGNQQSIDSIPNKYLAGGALAIGLVWYAHKKRMF